MIHCAEHHAVPGEKPVVAVRSLDLRAISNSAHICELKLKCAVARYGDAGGDNTGSAFSCI
jgi:hypothetical protein